MWALHARYRGRDTRRAELVKRFAEALSTLEGAGQFEVIGVEDIRAHITSPVTTCDVVMALLAAGDWAIGIGVVPTVDGTVDESDEAIIEQVKKISSDALRPTAKAGTVKVRIAGTKRHNTQAFNISAAFTLIGQVLSKPFRFSLTGKEDEQDALPPRILGSAWVPLPARHGRLPERQTCPVE